MAGGALLDIGVYGLTLAFMMLGEPKKCSAFGHLNEEGVDLQHTISLAYEHGVLATCRHTIESLSMNQAVCICENAYYVVEDIAKFAKVSIYNNQRQLLESYELDSEKTGYEYEVEGLIQTLEERRLEFSSFTHQETLRIVGLIDQISDKFQSERNV